MLCCAQATCDVDYTGNDLALLHGLFGFKVGHASMHQNKTASTIVIKTVYTASIQRCL